MNKLTGILSLLFCCVFSVHAQVQNQPDTTIRDYNNYDTTLPKTDFVDTVHHVVFSADSNVNKEQREMVAKMAFLRSIQDKQWMKTQIQNLSSYKMHGRGYVMGGRDSAAKYILKKFKEFKLRPVVKGGPWAQGFAFPVNTFPGRMYLEVNGDSLVPGGDFLIDPASSSLTAAKLKVKTIDLGEIQDTAAWNQVLATIDSQHAYCFENVDEFCTNVLEIRASQFAALLPAGCFIIPQKTKLTWSVSRKTIPATVFYIDKNVASKKLKKVSVDVNAQFLPHVRSENIIACMPGEVKDSFLVFSAHYDHLGMMGDTTYFPGASDNASGVAMLLYLASYFSKHPQHYSIIFIAFAGEEAALMGSEFFVKNPLVPLKSIRFLTNIDIMGDATDGVTVVNATLFQKEFTQLLLLNEKNKYIPEVRPRGPAANSDHYYFTESGVPSFFIYSNGGPGNYHDIFDRSSDVTLNHIDDVAKMLIDFTQQLH
jgi:aminopeptidase YwaD